MRHRASARAVPALLMLGALAPAAFARPVVSDLPRYRIEQPADDATRPGFGLPGLSDGALSDTIRYGGTVWSAAHQRWEAIRNSIWTFDTGVGSAIPPVPAPHKPAGYHSLMEGWSGLDLTRGEDLAFFRRSTQCAIAGSWSLHAGVTAHEADSLCYASGVGYGNTWDIVMARAFSYPGSGSVTLSFDYAVDAEPGFDYAYVEIDTTGTGAADPVWLAAYTGAVAGHATISLSRGDNLRSTPGPVTLRIRAYSDGMYSDEDGLYPTTCGHSTFDNFVLTGAIAASSTFETGLDGWSQVASWPGAGDFSNLVDMADLPPTMAPCPCGLADSVLVFFDTGGHHPRDQENIAMSPWVDLVAANDVGRAGRVIEYDIYAEMPLANYIFVELKVRYYPYVCPTTGFVRNSPILDQNVIFYYGESPYCPTPGVRRLRDYSSLVPPTAEQVQIGVGVLNLCYSAIDGTPCTGITNTTPWFDNVSLGVYGPTNSPIVTVPPAGRLQDNFSHDGMRTLNDTGRVDTQLLRTGERGTVSGDTLTAAGDGGNTEVRLVFKIRPGPFTSAALLSPWIARWQAEPIIGPGWYSARMDTAEWAGSKTAGRWMSTFHEDDPGFSGTDRATDATDPWQLANEILPDYVLTPGSRIDYFVAARYRPPDPRNPGGTHWSVDPDTTGGHYFEMEILPSSLAADSTWNCVLYVNHHADRDFNLRAIEEGAMTAALGTGGTNPEGTRFDRYDVIANGTGLVSFGRPETSGLYRAAGATFSQAMYYDVIAWHSGSLASNVFTNEDAMVLDAWLVTNRTMCQWFPFCPPYLVSRRFWGSGDGLAASMYAVGSGSAARNFLSNRLGAGYNCGTIRSATCPAGTAEDTVGCMPLVPSAGAHFAATLGSKLRGNGCPERYSFDLLGANASLLTAAGNLSYLKLGQERGFASVSNAVRSTYEDYRTVLDGFAVGRLRNAALSGCDDLSAVNARAQDIFGWFGSCPFPPLSGSGGVEEPAPMVPFQLALGAPNPNPSRGPVRISLVQGAAGGRVVLSILDVTGRRVATLLDGALAPGPHDLTWGGRDDAGRPVSTGLFFIRLTGGARSLSQKLIITP